MPQNYASLVTDFIPTASEPMTEWKARFAWNLVSNDNDNNLFNEFSKQDFYESFNKIQSKPKNIKPAFPLVRIVAGRLSRISPHTDFRLTTALQRIEELKEYVAALASNVREPICLAVRLPNKEQLSAQNLTWQEFQLGNPEKSEGIPLVAGRIRKVLAVVDTTTADRWEDSNNIGIHRTTGLYGQKRLDSKRFKTKSGKEYIKLVTDYTDRGIAKPDSNKLRRATNHSRYMSDRKGLTDLAAEIHQACVVDLWQFLCTVKLVTSGPNCGKISAKIWSHSVFIDVDSLFFRKVISSINAEYRKVIQSGKVYSLNYGVKSKEGEVEFGNLLDQNANKLRRIYEATDKNMRSKYILTREERVAAGFSEFDTKYPVPDCELPEFEFSLHHESMVIPEFNPKFIESELPSESSNLTKYESILLHLLAGFSIEAIKLRCECGQERIERIQRKNLSLIK